MKRRVFISYCHDDDQFYKDELSRVNDDDRYFIDESVELGDIDDSDSDENIARIIREKYLRQTSVIVVLLGKNTGFRKHIDWEIGSSLRTTNASTRSGMVVIRLPEFNVRNQYITRENSGDRIFENVNNGYAVVINWSDLQNRGMSVLEKAIDDAFNNKNSFYKNPSARTPFRKNNGPWRN